MQFKLLHTKYNDYSEYKRRKRERNDSNRLPKSMRSWLSVKNVSWSRLTFHFKCRPNHLKVGDLLEFIFIINPNKNYIFSIHDYFERIVSRLG